MPQPSTASHTLLIPNRTAYRPIPTKSGTAEPLGRLSEHEERRGRRGVRTKTETRRLWRFEFRAQGQKSCCNRAFVSFGPIVREGGGDGRGLQYWSGQPGPGRANGERGAGGNHPSPRSPGTGLRDLGGSRRSSTVTHRPPRGRIHPGRAAPKVVSGRERASQTGWAALSSN